MVTGFGLSIQHHQAQGPVYRDRTLGVLGRFKATHLRLEALFAKETGSGEIADVHHQKSRKKDGSRASSGSPGTHSQGLGCGKKSCRKKNSARSACGGRSRDRKPRAYSQKSGCHQEREQAGDQKSRHNGAQGRALATQGPRGSNTADASRSLAFPHLSQALNQRT